MKKKYLIYFISLSLFSCTNKKLVKKNREITAKLYNCSTASNAKDTIINKLYYEIKTLGKKNKSKAAKKDLLIENMNSRFQMCRKSLLDCKVSNSNLSEYNRKLIKNLNEN